MTWQPWRTAMDEALYGPDGFFVRAAPAEHFSTSVTASPVFASAVRRLAGLVDHALGRPDPFDVVDVGAGRGELLAALPDVPSRWRLTAVERAADPGLPGVRWTAEVPALEGLLLANEWLDNVPLDVVFDGRLVEVSDDGEERLGEPASQEALDWAAQWWPAGRRVEVGVTRDRAWAAAVAQVSRGLAVAVDYGHVLGNVHPFGDRRPSLTGHLAGRPVHPVPDGSRDLTAHVALDSVAAAVSSGRAARVTTQREALLALGVDATRPPQALSKTDPRGYLDQLATATAAATLLDPRGLGGFGWVVQPVGIDDPLPA